MGGLLAIAAALMLAGCLFDIAGNGPELKPVAPPSAAVAPAPTPAPPSAKAG